MVHPLVAQISNVSIFLKNSSNDSEYLTFLKYLLQASVWLIHKYSRKSMCNVFALIFPSGTVTSWN
jgi:hypothetical protein